MTYSEAYILCQNAIVSHKNNTANAPYTRKNYKIGAWSSYQGNITIYAYYKNDNNGIYYAIATTGYVVINTMGLSHAQVIDNYNVNDNNGFDVIGGDGEYKGSYDDDDLPDFTDPDFVPPPTLTDGEKLYNDILADNNGDVSRTHKVLVALASATLLGMSGAISSGALIGASVVGLGLGLGALFVKGANYNDVIDYKDGVRNKLELGIAQGVEDISVFIENLKGLGMLVSINPLELDKYSNSVAENIGTSEENKNELKNILPPLYYGSSEWIADKYGKEQQYINYDKLQTDINDLLNNPSVSDGVKTDISNAITSNPSWNDFVNTDLDINVETGLPNDIINHPSYNNGQTVVDKDKVVETDDGAEVSTGGGKVIEILIDVSGIISALNPLNHMETIATNGTTANTHSVSLQELITNKEMSPNMTEQNRLAMITMMETYGYTVDGEGKLVKNGDGIIDLQKEEYLHEVDGQAKIQREGVAWENIHSSTGIVPTLDTLGNSIDLPRGFLPSLSSLGIFELLREMFISKANANVVEQSKGEDREEDEDNEENFVDEYMSMLFGFVMPSTLELPTELQELVDYMSLNLGFEKKGGS